MEMVRPSLLSGDSHIETDIFTDQRRHTSWKRLYYYSTKDINFKNPTKILNADKIPKVEFDTSDRLIPPLTSYAKKSAEFFFPRLLFLFSSFFFYFSILVDYRLH